MEKIRSLGHSINAIQEAMNCPITHETFEDPVCDPHGHIFEKKAIMDWSLTREGKVTESSFRCPMNRQIVDINALNPVLPVKNIAQEVKKMSDDIFIDTFCREFTLQLDELQKSMNKTLDQRINSLKEEHKQEMNSLRNENKDQIEQIRSEVHENKDKIRLMHWRTYNLYQAVDWRNPIEAIGCIFSETYKKGIINDGLSAEEIRKLPSLEFRDEDLFIQSPKTATNLYTGKLV